MLFFIFIERSAMYKYLILLLIIGFCSAGHLLTNGDFEQPLNVGWSSAIGTTLPQDTIDRQIYFQPDLDYEARVKKYDATHVILCQTVNIPTTDLEFSVSANFFAQEYNSTTTYWAAAAVCLRYLDNNDVLLGETRIAYKTPHCPWTQSNTLHIISEMFSNTWNTYSFNVNSELANLTGVNPADIRKIQVAIIDTTDGC
jgi:hypothetical protein